MVRLWICVELSRNRTIGEVKIRLLEFIHETGSISAAGRAMRMSYRRAWLHLDELNRLFREPVATTARGGGRSGGTRLTPFAKRLIHDYRKMEVKAHVAVAPYMSMISRASRRR